MGRLQLQDGPHASETIATREKSAVFQAYLYSVVFTDTMLVTADDKKMIVWHGEKDLPYESEHAV